MSSSSFFAPGDHDGDVRANDDQPDEGWVHDLADDVQLLISELSAENAVGQAVGDSLEDLVAAVRTNDDAIRFLSKRHEQDPDIIARAIDDLFKR